MIYEERRPIGVTAQEHGYWTGREFFPPDFPYRNRLDSPRDRRRTWINSLFIDHQALRLAYSALERISEEMWRANQPAPWTIRRYASMGIRTIINLRGYRDCGSYQLEREACARAGLTLIDFPIRSRGAPERVMLRAAKHIFDTVEYPAVMHCKSGADRAGFMGALYLMLRQGAPVEEAIRQLSWRKGHFKHSKTGILDHFFECYAADTARDPMDLMTWIETRYDEATVAESFKPDGLSSALVDWVLRRE